MGMTAVNVDESMNISPEDPATLFVIIGDEGAGTFGRCREAYAALTPDRH